jgi:hypothetical protein
LKREWRSGRGAQEQDDDSREALGGADCDGDAARPIEGLVLLGGRGATFGMQVGEEVVVSHVVVDDEALLAAGDRLGSMNNAG